MSTETNPSAPSANTHISRARSIATALHVDAFPRGFEMDTGTVIDLLETIDDLLDRALIQLQGVEV